MVVKIGLLPFLERIKKELGTFGRGAEDSIGKKTYRQKAQFHGGPFLAQSWGVIFVRCLSCGLRAAHANGYPRWVYLRNRGCRYPLTAGEAAAREHEDGEVEPPPKLGRLADLDAAVCCLGQKKVPPPTSKFVDCRIEIGSERNP